MNKIKAIGITSGGLDSMLAALVLKKQGLDILLVCFTTPFFFHHNALRSAMAVGLPIKVVDITEDHLAMLRHPSHGFGACMNPCIDCHALMIRKAGEIMKEQGALFVFTGEVLGQRPFSQHRQALRTVARESGLHDLLLRPLSARLLDITVPEKEGWVNREGLLDISGRSRKQQMALAAQEGFMDYPAPAGGCLLTEKIFSNRLKDLFRHEENFLVRDVHLLKVGRHFRLNDYVKLVVGRNQRENETLCSVALPEDDLLTCLDYPGPTGLVPQGTNSALHNLAASICVSYSDAPPETLVRVCITKKQRKFIITAAGLLREHLEEWLI
jgi:tRNA U34 2-thiouridine synthase MnmA/TrmU